MSTFAEYTRNKKKKELDSSDVKKKNSSFSGYTEGVLGIDIAPVKTTTNVKNPDDVAPVKSSEKEKKWYQGWLKKSEGTFGQAVRASGRDLTADVGTGALGVGEKIVDAFATLAPYSLYTEATNSPFYSQKMREELEKNVSEAKEDMSKFAEKDLYNEEEIVAKKIINPFEKRTGIDVEKASVFDYKSDELAQSAGQLGVTIGASLINPALGTAVLGASAFGSEVENALRQGATYDEAVISASITAGAEILTEKLSGGISLGGKTLDDLIPINKLTQGISSKLVRNLINIGVDAAGEGFEEIVAGYAGAIGQKITYMEEKELKELFSSEEAIDSFVGGAILGGIASGGKAILDSTKGSGNDTEMSDDEKAVFDKVYQDAIYEMESDGKKLSNSEKKRIYDETLKKLEKGYIDIDTIESVLGGETYESLQSVGDNEAKLQEEYKTLKEEYDALNKMKQGEMTGEESDRRAELKIELENLKSKIEEVKNETENSRNQLKSQLDSEISKLVEGTRLAESYNEIARRGHDLEVDVESYTNDSAKQTAQNFKDFGVNNTNASHDYLDLVTKVAEDRGHTFKFMTTKQLEESIASGNPYNITEDASKVEAFVTGNTKEIIINMDANKSLSSLVGHEVMHTLEKANSYSDAQNALFEYAKTKGEYDDRLASIQRRYSNLAEEQQLQELTSDLVGDYIFGDTDFIRNLSTESPNVFKKIYNEIKYLWKMATAGSKEARELERVKRAFEKVWQEASNSVEAESEADLDVKYSVAVTDKETVDFLDNQEHIVTYKAMQLIDGKLYPPMAAKVKGENGKYQLTNPSELGKWQQATEDPKNIKKFKNGVGYYTLNKGDGTSVDAAYNPYEHSSNLVLNDQFESAHRRDNLVTVQGIIPVSEMTSGYKAEYAKDSTGVMDWHSGVVAGKLKDNKRQVYLSRYFKPVRIMEDSEVAAKYKEILDGQDVPVPFNVVSPSLLSELEKAGVDIDYDGSPMYQYYAKKAAEKGNKYSIADDGTEIKTDRESEVRYSLAKDTQYMDNAIAKNNASLMVDTKIMEDAKVLREKIAGRMNEIKDKGLVGLPEDIEGNTFISNSSYGGTEENTTICPRSLAAESFVDAVSEYLGRPLTVEEQIYISQDLQGRSLTPECTYCYVATDRKAYRAFLGEYISQRDSVIEKIKDNPDADVSRDGDLYKEFLNGRKDTSPMYKRFKMWVDAYKNGKPMIDPNHLANMSKLMGDINSEFGAELKPQITDAMKYAQSASWAKKRVNYVAYNGHILKWKQDRINKLNSHYGLRMYSFSDFHPAFTLENMQMITDASVRGLKMLGYTKDIDFVEIFAPSGMNINISTFGFVQDGVIAENNLIGAEWQKAQELREQYPNVGITFVATDDTLVNWALDQDWIDVVIPFHLVRTGKEVAKAFKYHDYTNESSDTKTSYWKKGDATNIAPTEHNNDKATYLAALKKNHLEPRFKRFVDNPNYMKLVNECRLPASESKPVQPIFNEDASMKALAKLEVNGYYQPVGGSVDRMYEIAAEVADKMQSELTPAQNRIADDAYTSKEYGNHIYAKDVALAPVGENSTIEENSSVEMPIRNNYAPLTEEEANVRDDRQIDEHYFMDDMPTETEEEYNGAYADHVKPDDPFYEKDIWEVGRDRKQKAYMYENPEVKPFFQQEARYMLGELDNSQKGEKFYNDQLYYDTNGEMGFFGTKRFTSEDIAYLLDTFNYTYKDIAKGLNAIIEDNGKENNAISKRIEFLLDERLRTGYTDFWFGDKIPPNQDYINLLNSKQITEYNDESWNNWLRGLSEEDIAYFSQTREDVAAPEEYMSAEPDVAPVKEEVSLYDAQPRRGVVEGQQSMFEESEAPKTVTRSGLHSNIINNIKQTFSSKGFDFDDVLKEAKNLSTFATVDNIPQRVMEKALGYKQGQVLSDLTVNKVAQNESQGTKWLNSFTDRKNGLLAQISKEYKIKAGSKESAAAQMYAEGFYVNDDNEIIKYGDAELAKDFPNQKVRENIKALAKDERIRQIYDDTLQRINESRIRNAYPEIPRLDNYFLHFRAMDDTFSRLGLPFNPNYIRAKDLPTDLNGVTADLKPGQPYFASQMHRTGKRTSFDLLGGLERYLTSAKNQIYHIDDIQTLRALRNYIADTYGQANGLGNLDALSEEEAQERIEQVYGSHLSTFAKFLNEEANVLAGKTALIDRGLEGIIGRRGITFLDTVNKQVGSNMVGYNVSSSLTNVIPVVQTFAKTNKTDFVKAFSQTMSNRISSLYGKNDGFAEDSPVMIRRKGADRFYRTPFQKFGDSGYVLMSAVDSLSTEIIARTKYNEFTRKGMDSQKAHYETDKWVSRLMGDRSLGQMPQLYNSKMLGLITKFQLEVRNQLDSQFYDTIQEAKVSNEHIQNGLAKNAKTAAKVASTFAQLAVAQHLFGSAFESITGYNPAFDIIEVLLKTIGYDDDEDSEDTVLDNVEQGFLALLEDLPYTSTFTGGRIPMSAALPVEEIVTGKDEYGNDKSRVKTLGEIAPYYALPTGYGQIKKTTKGLSMFDDDLPVTGSYTDSGNLRFPVEDTPKNRLQAGLFGQYASDVARDYFDNERNPLKEKQIQEFKDLEIPIRDYWDYREGLLKQETLEDKFEYVADLDVTVEQKNIMINNIVDRKEKVDMSNYDDFANYEEFDFYSKNTEKYNFLQDNGVSYSEYKSNEKTKKEYDNIYSWYKNNPEKVTLSKAVTSNVIEYRRYASDLDDIRADKDSNGNSISGSAKRKKIEYINSLDLEYGQRIILYRSLFDSNEDKNRYNADIIEYLDSREDISYEEMVTILESLDMKMHPDGRVTW